MIAAAMDHPIGMVTAAEEVLTSVLPDPDVVVLAFSTCNGTRYNDMPMTKKIIPNIIMLVLILFSLIGILTHNYTLSILIYKRIQAFFMT